MRDDFFSRFPSSVMARFMRVIQFVLRRKMDGPDEPGHDG
jgi:hypothetical protein